MQETTSGNTRTRARGARRSLLIRITRAPALTRERFPAVPKPSREPKVECPSRPTKRVVPGKTTIIRGTATSPANRKVNGNAPKQVPTPARQAVAVTAGTVGGNPTEAIPISTATKARHRVGIHATNRWLVVN